MLTITTGAEDAGAATAGRFEYRSMMQQLQRLT